MRPSFHPRLINTPFGDPGLYIPFAFNRQAVLFDLGDLAPLSPGDLIKTTHAFVTHTHMDHFIGFDQLLRLLLGRDKHLHLFGPPGFMANVKNKLQGYTWNLVHTYSEALTLEVTEVHPQKTVSRTFPCNGAFRPGRPRTRRRPDWTIHEGETFRVTAALLDHGIASLGFSLQERFHINILKPELQSLGLAVGPWLNTFKKKLFAGESPDTSITPPRDPQAGPQRSFTLKFLADRITRITPGQKIAYIADTCYTPANAEKIVALADKADHLFIEAAFLHDDRRIAAAKQHLTAHQAGTLARQAGVGQMTVFHHSPRYNDRGHLLEEEAQRAYSQ